MLYSIIKSDFGAAFAGSWGVKFIIIIDDDIFDDTEQENKYSTYKNLSADFQQRGLILFSLCYLQYTSIAFETKSVVPSPFLSMLVLNLSSETYISPRPARISFEQV